MNSIDLDERLIRMEVAQRNLMRAMAQGKVTIHPFSKHRKGCDCGHCDGTGEPPGGGVMMYSWLMYPGE